MSWLMTTAVIVLRVDVRPDALQSKELMRKWSRSDLPSQPVWLQLQEGTLKHEDLKICLYRMFSIMYVFGTCTIYNKGHLMPQN